MAKFLVHEFTEGPWQLQVLKSDTGNELLGLLWHGTYEIAYVRGKSLASVFQQLKDVIDPHGLMKVFDSLDKI